MGKTILVLIDACGFNTAKEYLGFLEHMTEKKQCAKYKVQAELPAMSRVNYETLMTGLPPFRHGVLNNLVVRRSLCDNVFSLCKKNGLTTAAAAYLWMSELYSGAPFNNFEDRLQLGEAKGDIDHGIFYFEDSYPDTHLFADAEFLRKTYSPDFMLVHPMGMDYKGHLGGCDSKGYKETCLIIDVLLSCSLPVWRAAGYTVIVTADHGMDAFGMHNGNTDLQRIVPLYIFSEEVLPDDFSEKPISQLNIAPLSCRLLGLQKSEEMTEIREIRFG